MASTNKTPQLGLNQWAAGDPVLREDFNGDNQKIDDGMALARDNMRVGSYVGNGVADWEIKVGFRPKLVILMGYHSVSTLNILFLHEERFTELHGGYVWNYACTSGTLEITDNGFLIHDKDFNNYKGNAAQYIAFR